MYALLCLTHFCGDAVEIIFVYQLKYFISALVVSLTLSAEAILSKAKLSEGRLVRHSSAQQWTKKD
jgi:hypothetical protein